MNLTVGVYTSQSQWTATMGSSFSAGKNYPLWYPHYQIPPQLNFDDFVSFGGWSKPYMKQYSGDDSDSCSDGYDANWLPTVPPPTPN